jgi:biotin-dependent carboxylase-like uncharacterized protein
MRTAVITVERSGYAVVQDLGRPGYAAIGIAGNGASDQRSARTANTLVGNRDAAPLLEVTGSELRLRTDSPLLVAVAGAAPHLLVDGHAQPAREPLVVAAGARIVVPLARSGLRSYLAVNAGIDAGIDPGHALGSVAPDPLIDVGRRLEAGDRLVAHTAYDGQDRGALPTLFRLNAKALPLGSTIEVMATPGPDLGRLAGGPAALDASFEVLPQSDHVGLRFGGPSLGLTSSEEILSRGVPVGAVEVPPSGDLLILMRGRLLTAGYPVVAVVTSASLDDLAQARPGDSVRISLGDVASARRALRELEDDHLRLAARVRRAFESRGLGGLVDPEHASTRPPNGSRREDQQRPRHC